MGATVSRFTAPMRLSHHPRLCQMQGRQRFGTPPGLSLDYCRPLLPEPGPGRVQSGGGTKLEMVFVLSPCDILYLVDRT